MASPLVESPQNRLLYAAFNGKLKHLQELGADFDFGEGLKQTFVDVKDSGGRTALHFAAAEGKTHICKYLVQDLGIDVNMKDGNGETPLNYATLGHHSQTVSFLAANGSNPNLANDKGFSALHYAAKKGFKDLIRLLISKGADIEAKSHAGTPLQCAAAHGRKEAVKMLLDKKANPNTVCHHIFTPLVNSILSGSFECASLLLKAGADPNLVSNGETPLGLAAAEGETEVIKCLLKAGANPNVTDINGLTPLEIAALHSYHAGVMVLLPVTSRMPTIPNWSLVGIMEHLHSEEGRRQREQKKKETFLFSKARGEEAFKRKDYVDAIYWYTQAINASPSDATALSNRSLCWARLNEGSRALSDAEACVMLRPDWGKAHYREGVAWRLLGNLPMSAEAFSEGLKVDPENKELQIAFREAVEAEFGVPVSDGIQIVRM